MNLKRELLRIADQSNRVALTEFIKEEDLYYSIYPLHAFIRARFDSITSGILNSHTYHNPVYIRDSLLSQLNLQVRNHMLQYILVHELAVAEKAGVLDESDNKSKLFQYIILTSEAEWIEYLFEKYMYLEKRLVVYLNNLFNHLSNVINRFHTDSNELFTFLRVKSEKIKKISLFLGDLHQDGQSVVLINFESKKTLYKPRKQTLEIELLKLLDYLNSRGAEINLNIPRFLNREAYSWTEFVSNNEVASIDGIKTFYFNQGKALALFHFLGSVDLMHENVIADGTVPSYIDLECVLSKTLPVDRSSEFFNFFEDSVVATGILPTLGIGNDLERDYFSGALHSRAKDKVKTNVWENQNSSEINFTTKEIYRTTVEAEKHLPAFLGEKIEINDEYIVDLQDGFKKCYHFFHLHKDLIVDFLLASSLFTRSKFRIIPHPTAVYEKIGKNLLIPEAFQSKKKERDVRRILTATFSFRTKAINRQIVKSILEQVNTGDIPYFFTKCDSRHLYNHKDETVVSNYFLESSNCQTKIVERIKNSSEMDLEMQQEIIRGSIHFYFHLNRGRYLRDDPAQYLHFNVKKDFQNEILDSVATIAEYIYCKSYSVNGELNWLAKTTNRKDQKYEFSPMTYDLYEGLAGISFFLLYASKYIKTEKYFLAAKQIILNGKAIFLRQKQSLLDSLTVAEMRTVPVSPFYYPSSLVFLMDHLYAFEQEALDHDFLEHYYDYLEHIIHFNENCDILSGLAGLLELLMSLSEKAPSVRLDTIISKTIHQIVASATDLGQERTAWEFLSAPADEKTFFGGYAHGTAGIAVTLARASKLYRNNDLEQLAIKALAYDRSLFNTEVGFWVDQREKNRLWDSLSWCHGSPGVGMSRVLLADIINDNDLMEEVKIAVMNTVKSKTESSCLCHGRASDIEMLVICNSILKDPAVDLKISKDVKYLTDQLMTDSFQMIYGDGTKMEMLGLFLGISGIGYSLLRLYDWENMPSILCLESSSLNYKAAHRR